MINYGGINRTFETTSSVCTVTFKDFEHALVVIRLTKKLPTKSTFYGIDKDKLTFKFSLPQM